MIRALLASALAAAATLGGLWLGSGAAGGHGEAPAPESEFVDVPMIAAPVFEGGTVAGYVLIEVGFEADGAKLAALSVPPEALLTDALHGFLLGRPLEIGEHGPDPDALREAMIAALNERANGALVRAFVLRVDHLRRDDIRDGSIRRRVRRATRDELEGDGSEGTVVGMDVGEEGGSEAAK